MIDWGRAERVGGAISGTLAEDESGAAAVEFALLLPLLVTLALGLIDVTRFFLHGSELDGIIRAAATVIRRGDVRLPVDGSGTDQSPVGAAEARLRLLIEPSSSAVLTARELVGCSSTGAITTALPTGTRCRNGSVPADFVEITVTKPLAPLLPWPGDLRNTAVVRHALVRRG